MRRCAGLLLVLRPGEGAQALTMLLGASLFLARGRDEAAASRCCAVKIIRHQQPDVIETAEFEIIVRKDRDHGIVQSGGKNRVLILMIALILMVPAVFGMLGTRINYDMLDYLPGDMDTVIGQNALMEDFGKGAFSFIVVQDMPVKDVAQLKEKIQQVDHVESVLWYDSVVDLSIPMELLPDKLYNEFNTGDATMMAVFFDTATSEDVTMDAIREIRSIAGKQCFVSGMSALVTDLKDLCEQEEPIYVAIAVVLACAAMMVFLDGWLIPFVFLASIGAAILHEPRQQLLHGRDFLHHQGTVRRAAAGRDDGLLHLPVAQLQRAARRSTPINARPWLTPSATR